MNSRAFTQLSLIAALLLFGGLVQPSSAEPVAGASFRRITDDFGLLLPSATDHASFDPAVSGDGSVVVGTAWCDDDMAWWWGCHCTPHPGGPGGASGCYEGVVYDGSLGHATPTWSEVYANDYHGDIEFYEGRTKAVSADGSVVAGRLSLDLQPSGQIDTFPAFRRQASGIDWFPDDPFISCGAYESHHFCDALDISSDGTRVAGTVAEAGQAPEATIVDYAAQTSSTPGVLGSYGTAISGDGATLVGYGDHVGNTEPSALAAQTLEWLGFLPGGSSLSEAHGISANGNVIVGSSGSAAGIQPFRWEAGVMIGLAHLPGASSGKAWAANADGSVVVGESGGRAFIWNARHGIRDLEVLLTVELGLDTSAFAAWGGLTAATDISDDGLTIVGNPGWVATVPASIYAGLPVPALGAPGSVLLVLALVSGWWLVGARNERGTSRRREAATMRILARRREAAILRILARRPPARASAARG